MRLYMPILIIKDPIEMLNTINMLEKLEFDYTLLTEETVGIRPAYLFQAMDIFKENPAGIGYALYTESNRRVSGIIIKSIEILENLYRVIYYVPGIGNIVTSANRPCDQDPILLVSTFNNDTRREETLYECATFLGFKVS